MSNFSRKTAYQTILFQTLTVLILALAFGALLSLKAGYSVLLGGVTTVVPALIFSWFAFLHQGARAAGKILQDFYLGELLKFVTMAVLFILILRFVPIDGLHFMLSFIVTQLIGLLIPRFRFLSATEAS